MLRHRRRQIVWFGVTAHPTAEWLARQISEAFPWDTVPRYVVRDREWCWSISTGEAADARSCGGAFAGVQMTTRGVLSLQLALLRRGVAQETKDAFNLEPDQYDQCPFRGSRDWGLGDKPPLS